MSNKCEWKAEQVGNKPAAWKFEPCSDKLYHDPAFPDQGKFRLNIGSGDIYLGYASFCPFCGADIRKPIPPKIEINIHPVFDDVWNMLTRDKIQDN